MKYIQLTVVILLFFLSTRQTKAQCLIPLVTFEDAVDTEVYLLKNTTYKVFEGKDSNEHIFWINLKGGWKEIVLTESSSKVTITSLESDCKALTINYIISIKTKKGWVEDHTAHTQITLGPNGAPEVPESRKIDEE